MARTNIFALALLALALCVYRAQAGGTTTITNNTPCDGTFNISYESFLCHNDPNIELSANGGKFSIGSGACVVDTVWGNLVCGGRNIKCPGVTKSVDSYTVTVKPAGTKDPAGVNECVINA